MELLVRGMTTKKCYPKESTGKNFKILNILVYL